MSDRRSRERRVLTDGTIRPGDRRVSARRFAYNRRVQSIPHRRPRETDLRSGVRVYTERRA